MTSLSYSGSWTNDQYVGTTVDPTGLSFTVTKKDGTTESVSPQAHTPTTWGDTAGTQTCTFTYTDGYDSVSCDVEATVLAIPVTLDSLTYSGTFATQEVGSAPDLTGITFTAHYSDSTMDQTVSSSDITVSPATWVTSGSQTLTMSYTDEYGTASTTATVTVENPTVTLTSISLTTGLGGQVVGDGVDISDAVFQVTYDTGNTANFDGSEFDTEGVYGTYGVPFTFSSSALSGGVWTTDGSQSLTITIDTTNDFWDEELGVEVATPAPSVNTTVTVASLAVLPVEESEFYYIGDVNVGGTTFVGCLSPTDLSNIIQPNGTITDGGQTVPCHGMWLNNTTMNNETVSSGDVLWYFVPYSDYHQDDTLPTSSDLSYVDGIGWVLGSVTESGSNWIFTWKTDGNPQSPIQFETTYVVVLGRVKSGKSSVATNTLKPSDFDELAKLTVTMYADDPDPDPEEE